MDLSYLLSERGVDPTTVRVLVMRHAPVEPELRKTLPWLAAERPALYEAYQEIQNPNVEKQMARSSYIVSCTARRPGEALFVGLYKVGLPQPLSFTEYWNLPENIELRSLGMRLWKSADDRPLPILRFDLQFRDELSELKGKLVLAWPPLDRTWVRWAERNKFAVKAILEESDLDRDMPTWDRLVLTWAELQHLPSRWVSPLSQWRGIYLIQDQSTGKAYVGSAYGDQNLYGRWTNYKLTGDGGNQLLRHRDPEQFRFSILQLVSPSMDQKDVVAVENSWKERLHTRTPFGLNVN